MFRNINETVKGMIAIIMAYGIIGMIIILLLAKEEHTYWLGFLLGIIMSVFYIMHMNASLDKALDMDEKSALNKIRKSYAIRIMASLAIMIICIYIDLANPIFMLVGLTSMKVAAYLQPFTDKLIRRNSMEKGR